MSENRDNNTLLRQYSERYFLAAGECNPEGELPLPLLVTRVIGVATGHANAWGVGYDRLIRDNQGWVLSRVTVEMKRYPRVGEYYTLSTWIEGYNRHFSQRNMALTADDGTVYGYVRTIWMVINFATRESGDISALQYIAENVLTRPCPIEPQRALRPFEAQAGVKHTFGYIDCDFNRHVNTVRYVDLLLDRFPLDFHDANSVKRLEVAFVKESRYDETADITLAETSPLDYRIDIAVDGAVHVKARLLFNPRLTT